MSAEDTELPSGFISEIRPDNLPVQEIFRAKNRLNQLWWGRNSRNVVRDVLPFTSHSISSIQQQAVMMLGRLEDPAALDTLREMEMGLPPNNLTSLKRTRLQLGDTKRVLAFAVRLAIARIENRQMTGREKIERVLAAVEVSFEQIAAFTFQGRYDVSGAARAAVDETFDLLYQQAKKGVDISGMLAQCYLTDGHKILFGSVTMPPAEQRKFILEAVGQKKIYDTQLFAALLDSGPQAAADVINFAPHFINEPKKYPEAFSYIEILNVLAHRGDERAKEVLEMFSESKKPYLEGHSMQKLRDLENNFPLF